MSVNSAEPVLLRRPLPPTKPTIVDIINKINSEKTASTASHRYTIPQYGNKLSPVHVEPHINRCGEEDDDYGGGWESQYPASTSRSRQSFTTFQPFAKTPARHNSLQETVLPVQRSCQTLVQPAKPRGPDPLPPRPPKHKPNVFYVALDDDLSKYYQPPKFTLQDFIIQFSAEENVPVDRVQQTVYSHHTYHKLHSLLQERCQPRNANLSVQELRLPDELPPVMRRIPQKQLLIEMAAVIKDHLKRVSGFEMRSLFCPVSTAQTFGHRPSPCAEIFFYRELSSASQEDFIESEIPGTDSIVHGPTTRHFHGSKRSGSPFATGDDGIISPAELGVLDSLLGGGQVLSLKAQFISMLPDLRLIIESIEYINLSFNNFQTVPVDIFSMPYLSVLLLRNNPLREIPGDIEHLHSLKTCVFSFCLLTSLPAELFMLPLLEHLDVSYNLLTSIPNDIRNATSLEELNVEGNQLMALPTGILRLKNLKQLKVCNNFMHPVFWKDAISIQIQSLFELSCVAASHLDASLRDTQRLSTFADRLNSQLRCEACGGPRYSNCVRVIRPVSQICGVRNVPILFHCCTVKCKNRFLQATDELSPLLYGPGTTDRRLKTAR